MRSIAGSTIHRFLYLHKEVPEDCFLDNVWWSDQWDEIWNYCLENPRNPAEKNIPLKYPTDFEDHYHDLKNDGLSMLRGYYINKPDCKVILAEYNFKTKIGKYPFEGTIDQVWEINNQLWIVDFKSGAFRVPADDTVLESYQAAVYALGLRDTKGFVATHFVWCNLRDFIPYTPTIKGKNKIIYKNLSSTKNFAMVEWLKNNGKQVVDRETGELTDKYALNTGQLRGPGLYIFELSKEWYDSREYLITSAAGELALSNPTPMISENCEICDMRTQCRAKIYNKVLPKELLNHLKGDEP